MLLEQIALIGTHLFVFFLSGVKSWSHQTHQ